MQCREAAEQAMRATAPRIDVLRDVLTRYRQTVEATDAGSVKGESEAVQEAGRAFREKLEEVKGVLLRLADEAGDALDSTLEGLQKDQHFVTIALFGQTRAGKSTTLEALIAGDGETIGKGGQHTTAQIGEYFWPPGQRTLRIVDTPGIEGLNGEELAERAHAFVERADHLFFLVTDDKVRSGELEALANIRSMGKGITVLLNLKQKDEMLDLLVEAPELLFDERKISEHTQRIEKYLKSNHDISTPKVLPIHARAAWLATRQEHRNRAESLHEVSRIDSVKQRIREFTETEAFGARIESPRQAVRSHVVSLKRELRRFAREFRREMTETHKLQDVLEKAVAVAKRRAVSRLPETRKPFQAVAEQIPSLVDGLIAELGGGKRLSSEWARTLRSGGVEDASQGFVEEARQVFAEELNEQVRRLEFDATIESDLRAAQSDFDELDDYHKNKTYRRAGRAALKVAGGIGGGVLTTWAVANFWNPTGWVAAVAVSVGALLGGKAAQEIVDEWRKIDRRNLRKRRDGIVHELQKGLWQLYEETNDACHGWLERFEATLLEDVQQTLTQISRPQRRLWRASVKGLARLDRVEDDLALDVVAGFAALVVPEIASGEIKLVRVARWEGRYAKLLVAPKHPMENVLGRCIGVGGARVKKLSQLLGGDHVAWVESGMDFRTQIAQALSPARIEARDMEPTTANNPIRVRLSSDQKRAAIGLDGSNVRMAAKLLQVDRIKIDVIG